MTTANPATKPTNPLKLLFICTHNRCRSVLCEAIANQSSGGALLAVSAGSSPVGQVHPLTLQNLQTHGFSTEGLSSQSWDEHEGFNADIVFTVCDSAAGEACPVWFGKSIKAHWGLVDPSKLADNPAQAEQAFNEVIATIKERMHTLTQLAYKHSEQGFSKQQLSDELAQLGATIVSV